MICSKCGNQNDEGVKFCRFCGNSFQETPQQYQMAPQPAPAIATKEKKAKKEKKEKDPNKKLNPVILMAIGLIAGLVIGVVVFKFILSGMFGTKYEGSGFKTPEEAATAYLEAYSTGDMDKIISCFAVESYVENSTMENCIDRFGGYISSIPVKVPNYGDISQNINLENRHGDISKMITSNYNVLSQWELPMDPGHVVPLEKGGSASKYVKKYFPNEEETITNGLIIDEIYEPNDLYDKWDDEKNEESREKVAECFGADEITSVCIVFHTDNGYYALLAGLVEYDGKWYMDTFSQFSSIMGLDANHGCMCYIGDEFDDDILSEVLKYR